MKLVAFRLLILLLFLLCYSLSNAQYKELYVPQLPNEIKLQVDENSLEKYRQSIQEISDSKIPIIEKINKQYFPLNISFENNSQIQDCKARARINGDWKDHIRPTEKITSLTIQLKNCFIGGLSRFRLLLPETKKGSMEVFWSMLMEEYGFPTLYSQIIDVALNGIPYRALLMEMPGTAFLERHGLREAPIIEADEQQLWNSRAHAFYRANVFNDSNYAESYRQDIYQIFSDFGALDNKEYADQELKSRITMRGLSQYISKRDVLNSNFFYKVQEIWARHGLSHNKKFIYVPMTGSFIPLYYDGMVEVKPSQEKMPISSRAPAYYLESCADEIDFPGDLFAKEFTRRTREQLSFDMKCLYQQVSRNLSHLSNWDQIQLDINIDTGWPPLNFQEPKVKKSALFSGYEGIYTNILVMKGGKYFLCKTTNESQVCDSIDFKRAHKILTKGEVIKIGEHKFVATSVIGELDPSIESKGIAIEAPSTYNIDIKAGQKYYLHVKSGNSRNIHINLQGAGARAIVYGELNDKDKVSISGDAPNVFKDSRHDELMLTGCTTFLNTKFDNPSLRSTATGCEDAINILNSNGTIRNINIQYATEDALDLDFSNLKIESLHISGAGNDCLDISTGNYQIGSASLKNCSDKAVSAGEYAQVKLDKIVVDGATLGLVAKDGALLSVNQFEGFNIKEKCIDTYIKKKRFPIGHVYSLSKQCAALTSKATTNRN